MKMKKKVLSAGVLTALCMGSAQAVNLSTDGMGEVAIVPFYTIRNDNEGNAQKTLISIVNKTNQHKALKVRVREARNSREVLDFNLYLSPNDVWTGALQDGVTGPYPRADGTGADIVTGPGLVTSDTSCTVPAFYDADGDGKNRTAMFTTHAYAEYRNGLTASGERYDGGVAGDEHVNERMYEGYIEIIEMGVEDPTSPDWGRTWDAPALARDSNGNFIADIAKPSDVITNSDHTTTGVPNSCAGLESAWVVTGDAGTTGRWAEEPNAAMDAPTGGLFASAAVISVDTGTEISVPVTMLANFADEPLHTHSSSQLPTLAQPSPPESQVAINTGNGLEVITDGWTVAADATSAVLMAATVSNEYSVNPAVEAETSWVVTFPTKHFYVDWSANEWQQKLFTNRFIWTSQEEIGVRFWDREEQQPGPDTCQTNPDLCPSISGPQFSPAPIYVPPETPEDQRNKLDYEVNIVNFEESNLFGNTRVATTYNGANDGVPYNSGWAGIVFGNDANWLQSFDGTVYTGLPVRAFRATRIMNANAGDGAAYSISEEHVYQRVIE